MVSNPENLNNLVTAGLLRPHQPQDWEITAHLERAKNLLHDAKLKDATLDGRYNNAYSAAHALAQAAFKLRGFRTTDSRGHRQTLFSALEHAVPAIGKEKSIFEKAHSLRNKAEYEGDPIDLQQSMVDDLLRATESLQTEVKLLHKAWRIQQPRTTSHRS